MNDKKDIFLTEETLSRNGFYKEETWAYIDTMIYDKTVKDSIKFSETMSFDERITIKVEIRDKYEGKSLSMKIECFNQFGFFKFDIVRKEDYLTMQDLQDVINMCHIDLELK